MKKQPVASINSEKKPKNSAGIIKKQRRSENSREPEKTISWESVFRAIGTPVLILSPDYTILAANDTILRLTGKTETELRNMKCWEVFHGHDAKCPPQGCPMEKLLISKKHETADMKVSLDSGCYLVSCTPVFDKRGVLTTIIHIATNITGTKKIEREHEILIKDLAQKNDELERFTYTVSHDLQSPLTTIRGFASLVEEDIRKNDKANVARDLERINKAAQKMETLLQHLLTLSRIGRIANPPENAPFVEIAQEAVELLHANLHVRHVKVTIDPGMPSVNVDRIRMREAIINLIDNAIKFMGDQSHPEIHIGTRYVEGSPVFFVRDNGIGIELKNYGQIFNLFEKLDDKKEGSGAGLAIVKRIIEVHGGKIWVESKGNGNGCTFLFTLPALVTDKRDMYNKANRGE